MKKIHPWIRAMIIVIGLLLILTAVLHFRQQRQQREMDKQELEKLIADIQKKMQKAAAELNFEAAAEYRDKMVELKNMLREL